MECTLLSLGAGRMQGFGEKSAQVPGLEICHQGATLSGTAFPLKGMLEQGTGAQLPGTQGSRWCKFLNNSEQFAIIQND